MSNITDILPIELSWKIFDLLNDYKKNIFTQTCLRFYKMIYSLPKNDKVIASFYINIVLKTCYRIDIPIWFICWNKEIYTFFYNLFGNIIKGNKIKYKKPSIFEIKKIIGMKDSMVI